MLYELIIRRLEAIDRKCDRLIDDVKVINERLEDTEYQRYIGGAR
ncbi:hypothetical protein [Mesobacillus subterraneus]|nr:hypothetical protein [Mesobacillus subterraneus]